MIHKAQTAYRVASGLFLVGVLGQVLLAGLGLFAHPANFVTHVYLGAALHGLATLMWLLAVLGRQPLETTRLNGVLFGVLALQGLLPNLRGIAPALAALHPVNALVIFWLALVLARRAQAFAWLRTLRKPTVAARQPVYLRPAHTTKS
ncbi:MAG: DUF6220 domain-containing protein [Anaerolineae bacterium]